MILIIICLIGVCILCLCSIIKLKNYIRENQFYQKKLNEIKEKCEQTEKEYRQLRGTKDSIEGYVKRLQEEQNKAYQNKQNLDKQLIQLSGQVREENRVLNTLKQQNQQTAQLSKESVDREINEYKLNQKKLIERDLENFQKQIEEQKKKNIEDIEKNKEQLRLELQKMQDEVEDFRRRREVINQQVLREKEKNEQTDFYRVCLSNNDIEDLRLLENLKEQFHNQEIVSKVAYDCYIKKPGAEMIKRVLNGRAPSGIYCITYIPTGEIYIGRAVDISKRWTEHLKSAMNCGTIAHSSLHTKMARDGIQNFTFQVLEEVEKDKLNEREKFYIDLYQSTQLMNEKAGG